MATEYKEPRVGSEVIEYLLHIELDLKLVIGFILITLAFIYVPIINDTILRSIFGLAMILFFPGYSLISALFPGRSDISILERAALSFGLSIAVVPLIGLGLNYTPWGIRLDPIVVSLAIFTLACTYFANQRRHELAEGERFHIDTSKFKVVIQDMIFSDKTAVDKALTAILIVSILVCALTVSYVIMFPKQGEKYTEFYILGTDGKADNYPLQFSEGAQKPVVVGVMNHEHRDVAYDLVVALEDGANITTLHSERIVLADNETRENTVNLTSDHAGTGMKADFLLYIDGNMTAPYRECYLWVNVTEKSKNAH